MEETKNIKFSSEIEFTEHFKHIERKYYVLDLHRTVGDFDEIFPTK